MFVLAKIDEKDDYDSKKLEHCNNTIQALRAFERKVDTVYFLIMK